MKSWLQGSYWLVVAGFLLASLVGAFSGLFAIDPSQLEILNVSEKQGPPPIVINQTPPEATPPPPDPVAPSDLSLAPEALSDSTPPVGGMGFGQGSGGLAIAGQGGFGGDASSLVRQATAVDRPPRAIAKSAPEYPAEARQRSVSGHVRLNIYVNDKGSIENVKVLSSEPPGFFDQAALQSVKKWKFEAALSKGKPVAAWTEQRIKFELE